MHDDHRRDDLTAVPEGSGGGPEHEERVEIEFISDADDDESPAELLDEQVLEAEETVAHDVLLQEVARLRKEHDELHEMYLRKLAEFDNYRKRTLKEREELQKTAAEGVFRELLPVIDNFERALQHVGNGDPEVIREGVAMIARQLWDLLQREGVEPLDPLGQQFEPELHEAVQRVEDSDQPPGTVVAVLAKGYTFAGRLLRPAMVAVAVEPVRAALGETTDRADEEGPHT